MNKTNFFFSHETSAWLSNLHEKGIFNREDICKLMKQHKLDEAEDDEVEILMNRLNEYVNTYFYPIKQEDFIKTYNELKLYVKNARKLQDKSITLGFSARFGIRLFYGRDFHGCDLNAVPEIDYFEDFEKYLNKILNSAEKSLQEISGVAESSKKRSNKKKKGKRIDSELETLILNLADFYEEISPYTTKPNGPGRNNGKFYRFAHSITEIIDKRRSQNDKKRCVGKGDGFRKFVQRTVNKREKAKASQRP